MRATSIIVLAILTSFGLKAQNNDRNAIRQWQSLHPTTLLISSERYNSLSPEEQKLLGTDLIVFQEKITLEQLQQYDAEKEKNLAVAQKPPVARDEDRKIVKDWLGQHRDVTVIPQSKYITLNEFRLQQVQSAAYIVLEGEFLTVRDIESYTTLYGQ